MELERLAGLKAIMRPILCLCVLTLLAACSAGAPPPPTAAPSGITSNNGGGMRYQGNVLDVPLRTTPVP